MGRGESRFGAAAFFVPARLDNLVSILSGDSSNGVGDLRREAGLAVTAYPGGIVRMSLPASLSDQDMEHAAHALGLVGKAVEPGGAFCAS